MTKLSSLLSTIPPQVRLVVASKYFSADEIATLHKMGLEDFGENQVQALVAKRSALAPQPINWHFIGSLQKNKINALLAQRPVLWHSCSGLDLALAVDKRLDYPLPTLLQINISGDKAGVEPGRAVEEYEAIVQACPRLKMSGVMCLGIRGEGAAMRRGFEEVFRIYERLQGQGAVICSMGMSEDYELAIKCGSNLIRLGSLLRGLI